MRKVKTVFNGVPTYKQLEELFDEKCRAGDILKTIYDDGYYVTRKFKGRFIHRCYM